MMQLEISSVETTRTGLIDLEWLITSNDGIDDDESAHGYLVARIAKWAFDRGVSLDSIVPGVIEDGSGDSIDVVRSENKPYLWMEEVAKLAYYLHQEMPAYKDEDLVYAYIENSGWRWTDFDCLDSAPEEGLIGENVDAEEYGREWMDEVGEGIPERLQGYFDYRAYGESLLENCKETEWNGKTFKYND